MTDAADRIVSEHMELHLSAIAASRDDLFLTLPAVGRLMADAIRRGNKILVFGNGGSAAQAQHFAAELTGRFERTRSAMPALSLAADCSAITAIANDFGFTHVFARQCEALARPGDIAVGLSTSGRSENVVAALAWCRSRGCLTVALTGAAGLSLRSIADHVLAVPATSSAVIQELHLLYLHLLCRFSEEAFAAVSTRVGRADSVGPRTRPVLFLDRDGTIMRDVGYPDRPEIIEIMPHAIDGLKEFADHGYHLVVVSNQSGVARGILSVQDVARVNEALARRLREHGIELDTILFCPHAPQDGCTCRKPNTDLFEFWLRGREVDLSDTWLVGDRPSDIEAGKALGLKTARLCGVPCPSGSSVEADADVADLKQLATMVLRTAPLAEKRHGHG